MGNGRSEGVGLGIRLSRAEMRRLDELARVTGRNPAGVIRALLATASPRDEDLVSKLKVALYRSGGCQDAGL